MYLRQFVVSVGSHQFEVWRRVADGEHAQLPNLPGGALGGELEGECGEEAAECDGEDSHGEGGV